MDLDGTRAVRVSRFGRLRRWMVGGITATLIAVVGAVAFGASPAVAGENSGGAYSCPAGPPQKYVTTWTKAAGHVYHQKKIGGIWETKDFGTVPSGWYYWYKYYNVQGWYVYGETLETGGVSCML